MSIVLFPTDIEDNEMLDKIAFLNWTTDSKWSKVMAGQIAWYPELQDEFEAECARYWLATGQEEGFFPGGKTRAVFFAKMSEPKIPNTDDMKARNSALAALEAARDTHKAQLRKVAMCEAQLEQSKDKLESVSKRLANAEERWKLFKDVAFYASTDF